MDKTDRIVGGCLGIVILAVVSIIMEGLVLSVVWNWFMPLIFGLPELTLIQALVVSLVIGYLTKATVPEKEGKSKDLTVALIEGIMMVVLRPLVFLAIAFVFKWLMGV